LQEEVVVQEPRQVAQLHLVVVLAAAVVTARLVPAIPAAAAAALMLQVVAKPEAKAAPASL
jgi:hypothetical protein